MCLWHGEEAVKDRRLTASKSEPGWAAVPVSLQCVSQGCGQTGQSAGGQVSERVRARTHTHTPSLSHLSTLCPALTDVPPVVGVPSTLVVGKAQLHLNTVGGGERERIAGSGHSGKDGHVLLFTPVLGKELRTLVGERGRSTKLQ